MKYGAIDIGTNSVRLLIAEIEGGKVVNSMKRLETTRIGENVDKTGELSAKAIDRTIKALKRFKLLIKNEGLSLVPVIATSAVRDSKNKLEFLDRVKSEVDMDINIITGKREAELGFFGVLKGLREVHEDILVVDIGGGSTELIVGNDEGIKYMVSLNIGAVRMTEKFIKNDSIIDEEINTIVSFIDKELVSEMNKIERFHIGRVIGIGGTATTLAAVDLGMTNYDQNKIHNYDLRYEATTEILNNFMSKGLDDRKKIPGLQPKRADVIIAGTIILHRIMELLNVGSLGISEYDNLEGLVFEQIGKK